MAFLTDRTLATGVTTNDLIHIVITGDTSQNPAGSSYKATMGQVLDLINPTTLTGGTYDSVTGSITFYNDSGGSFTVTGLVTGFSDTFVTAFTYNNANTFTVTENDGSSFSSSINAVTGLTFNGFCQTSGSTALGTYSFSIGFTTQSIGNYSHAEGGTTIASGDYSHSEGAGTIASGSSSHAEGRDSQSIGPYSHAEGGDTQSIGPYSHSEGNLTISSGNSSHSEGLSTQANGDYSHSEGVNTITYGDNSHAEGDGCITSINAKSSHAEGNGTFADGQASHSEGEGTITYGDTSHAEGHYTTTYGTGSHAEGSGTTTYGQYSHSEGLGTTTYGEYSHSEGLETIAVGDFQHTQGQYNLTASTQSAFIIGNGTSDLNRSNLVFAAGNSFNIFGDLTVSGTIYSTGSTQFISTTGITTSAITITSGVTYWGINYSGNVDTTIPDPTNLSGLKLIIKDEGGNAGSYRIRITTSVGTIDGNSYIDMNINYMSLTFVARNNNWWII